jgi:transposase
VIHVGFPDAVCRQCRARSLCTRAKTAPRELTFRRAGYHEAVQERRRRQTTPEWRALYGVRAGVEGCLSQAVRLCGLRRSRYVGIAKTRLQHLATAAAVNIFRLDAWLTGPPFSKTRVSHFAALKLAAA